MRSIEELQPNERRDVVYIIEKRIDEPGRWVIYDSLSYFENYLDAVTEYKEIMKNNPGKKYRIAKAICVFHVEYGISTSDFDYERIGILPFATGLARINRTLGNRVESWRRKSEKNKWYDKRFQL